MTEPFTACDMETALAHRERVTDLRLEKLETVPAVIGELLNLEQLTLSGEFTELPLEIAKLERLQRLELIWCWGLRRLPDEVLCIPSLREIGLGDNGLPRVYNQRQINTWLAGLHPWRRSRRSGIST